MDLGVHAVDFALYLLGYPAVTEVSARTRSEFGDYHVKDSASALLRCADAATVAVDADQNEMHLAEGRGFLDAGTSAGDPPGGTVKEALTVQRVIDAIYESSDRGWTVALDDASQAHLEGIDR